MQFLVIGDLQVKKENLHLADQVLLYAESQDLNVIWLGDLLDRRGYIEAECLNHLFNYFKRSRLHHYIIVGNHDLIGVHDSESALEPLKALKNVWVIDSPTFFPADCKGIFIPYYRDPAKFLKALEFPGIEYVFCHQGIKEFTLGSGYAEDEAVTLDDLKRFKLVVAGHYHTPMEKGNVIYLGSPFSHSFGESNEQKRYGIFDSDTLQLTYVSSHFPQHTTLNITLPLKEPISIRYFGFDENQSLTQPTRAIVTGTEQEIAKFQFEISGLFPGVKFIYKPITLGKQVLIGEQISNTDKFIKWAKEVKNLDQAIIDLGLELLK